MNHDHGLVVYDFVQATGSDFCKVAVLFDMMQPHVILKILSMILAPFCEPLISSAIQVCDFNIAAISPAICVISISQQRPDVVIVSVLFCGSL